MVDQVHARWKVRHLPVQERSLHVVVEAGLDLIEGQVVEVWLGRPVLAREVESQRAWSVIEDVGLDVRRIGNTQAQSSERAFVRTELVADDDVAARLRL